VIQDTNGRAMERIRQILRTLDTLAPYEAALAYREVVRLEQPYVSALIDDPFARGKYATYLKRFAQAPPRRYFSDHSYARKLVPALTLARSTRVQSVLDAACGNGFEAVLFALCGKSVVANDISSARVTVTEARRRFYSELLGPAFRLTVTCGSALDVKQQQPFDMVYVQEAISHIHPAEAFLEGVARRLLARDGRLVICDSNSWNPVTRTRVVRHLWQQRRTLRYFVEEQHELETGRRYLMAEERLFNPSSIAGAMRAAGLEVEAVTMSGFVPPPLIRMPRSPWPERLDRMLSHVPLLRLFGGFYTAVGKLAEGGRASRRGTHALAVETHG